MGNGSGVLAVISSIGLAATALSTQGLERGARMQLESRYQYVITSVESLQTQLQRFAKAAKESDEQLQWLRSQLERERARASLNRGDLDLQTSTLEQLRSQITELETIKTQLENRLREASDRLTSSLAKPSADGSVTLEKIVVESRPVSQGKVLMVNTDYNFVVLNVGEDDGVRVGDMMAVYHGNKIAARVRVERSRNHTAAASLLPGWPITEVHEQDVVRGL